MKDKAKYIKLLEQSLCHFPFTQINLITSLQGLIEDTDTILDIGCGMKNVTRNLACNSLTGIDIYEDYLVNGDVCGDVTELEKYFQPKSFDIVLSLDLIEHLKKEDGYKLIENMTSIAKKKVLIMTPCVWSENKSAVENNTLWSYGNKYNYHQSFWELKEFIDSGFTKIDNNFFNEFILVVKEIC